jgi:hypothetical protein
VDLRFANKDEPEKRTWKQPPSPLPPAGSNVDKSGEAKGRAMDDYFQFGPIKERRKKRLRAEKQHGVQAEAQQAEAQQAEAQSQSPVAEASETSVETGAHERSLRVNCPDPTCLWPNPGDATSCVRCRKPLARTAYLDPEGRGPLEALSIHAGD